MDVEENRESAGTSPVGQVSILTDLKIISKIIWEFSAQPCSGPPIIQTCQSLLAWDSIETCSCAPAVQA